MKEEENMFQIGKIKKIRFLSRILIIAFLTVAAILYYEGVDTKIICSGFIGACVVIMLGIGFPTQKKLNQYELKLMELEDKE